MTKAELAGRLAEVADAISGDPDSKANQLLAKLIQDLMLEQYDVRD